MKVWKQIAEDNPNLRFIFIPHNASADADTRAQMAIMILEDILSLALSKNIGDIKSIHLIPEQRNNTDFHNFKIQKRWN